jgi:glycosyltransferase involved in cell wall biosynthesis
VTEAERAQLAGIGIPGDVIRVIPHPVDLSVSAERVTRGAFRRRFRIPWDEIVLYLGKLTPRKGLDVLVRAFASLRRRSVGLVIAGNDMGVGSQVRRLVSAHGLEERTLFTGLVRGSERLEALADADVLTYPSQHEVFGLAPIEAILCGTPVIVSDDSGCGEVIGQTGGGEIVPHGNSGALAGAIQRILSHSERWRGAASRAALSIRERYDSDVVFARLDELYRETLARE